MKEAARLREEAPAESLKQEVPLLTIFRGIFHFVPVKKRGQENVAPTLMPEETPLDNESRHLMQDRAKRSLLSPTHSYDAEFNPNNITPVKGLVEAFFINPTTENFINTSQEVARSLFTVQKGSVSPGLLCMLDCRLGEHPAVAIVKLENETGSRLFEVREQGHHHFQMQVLKDLFLTEGTRVFKSALFKMGSAETPMRILVCDDQRGNVRDYELARFFLEQFLGCKRIESGQLLTKRFYNSTVEFLNTKVTNPVERNDLYDDLTSQLRRQKRRFDVMEFARDFVPKPLKDPFVEFMRSQNLPDAFDRDTSEINKFIYRKQIRTEHNIHIKIPEDARELVHVEKTRIIINDIPSAVSGNVRAS